MSPSDAVRVLFFLLKSSQTPPAIAVPTATAVPTPIPAFAPDDRPDELAASGEDVPVVNNPFAMPPSQVVPALLLDLDHEAWFV